MRPAAQLACFPVYSSLNSPENSSAGEVSAALAVVRRNVGNDSVKLNGRVRDVQAKGPA